MVSRRLFKFSLFTRFLIISLQVVFNFFVPDHNADAFRLPYDTEDSIGNAATTFLLSGFSRWDAQYFLHIALYGYTHENTLAFFPLFPVTLREIAHSSSYLLPPILSELNLILLTGVIFNCLLFSFTTVFLYKLTYTVFHSEIIAYTSALLFTINPASIFFSALYSESLFSFLTFGGLWALESCNLNVSLLLLALSTSVRSNGTLSSGFIVYYVLKQCINNRLLLNHLSSRKTIFMLFNILKLILYLILFSIPFVGYQTYCYLLYCTDVLSEPEVPDVVLEYVTRNDLKIPSDPSKWCYWNIPLSYSYVQSRYWEVGFLRYFDVKQIPNFFLASPITVIVMFACLKYLWKQRHGILYFGLLSQPEDFSDLYSFKRCFPYFLHALIITLFSMFCIHIQVVTRLLCSSSPILYWVAAMTLLPSGDKARFKFLKEHFYDARLVSDMQFIKKLFLKSSIYGKTIFCYFVSYFLIGTFLHVNFFPWT